MSDCPCSSQKAFAACCQPYITGNAAAPTAEALMRARYTSYATGAIDFIAKTQAPEGRANFDRQASEKWSKESTWKGLRVVLAKDGGPGDTTGMVRFIAVYSSGGKDFEHEEIATFRKEGTTWLFVNGKTPKLDPHVNTGPTLGRNDPCHCGSKKKFKKCHGR